MTDQTEAMSLAWLLFPVAVVLGAGLGYVRGGRFSRVSVPWTFVLLILVALSMQLAVGRIARVDPALLLAATYGVSVACVMPLWRSTRKQQSTWLARLAVVLLLAGTLLNTSVIAANDGMPVSRAALDQVGQGESSVSGGWLIKHIDETSRTRLGPLGDVIAVAPLRTVVSLGDLVLLMGIAMLITASMAGCKDTPTAGQAALIGHISSNQ